MKDLGAIIMSLSVCCRQSGQERLLSRKMVGPSWEAEHLWEETELEREEMERWEMVGDHCYQSRCATMVV